MMSEIVTLMHNSTRPTPHSQSNKRHESTVMDNFLVFLKLFFAYYDHNLKFFAYENLNCVLNSHKLHNTIKDCYEVLNAQFQTNFPVHYLTKIENTKFKS